jgi:hypothetical protein
MIFSRMVFLGGDASFEKCFFEKVNAPSKIVNGAITSLS